VGVAIRHTRNDLDVFHLEDEFYPPGRFHSITMSLSRDIDPIYVPSSVNIVSNDTSIY